MFSSRLRRIRTKRKLSQTQLANLIGISKSSVCCYEKGTRTPTLEKLLKISDILHVDYSYLLGSYKYVIKEDDIAYGNDTLEEIDK